MLGRVPFARRTLFAERRRAALAVTGVSVALLLVFVLDGIFAGAIEQVTAYIRTSRADAIVSQQSVRTMHMSSSALPTSDIARVRAVPAAAWVAPIRYATGIVVTPRDRQLAYVIGYQPGRHGGPRSLVHGREPRDGEAVIDQVAARGLGVGVGGRVQILGRPFRVTGLSSGTTSITNTIAFITYRDFGRVRGSAVSYIFVGARRGTSPDALRQVLASAVPNSTVQTRSAFVQREASIVRDMSADTMQIMTFVALVIALAVIALLLFTTTLAHLRDYGIVKAIGGSPAQLARSVLVQALWAVALALALAVVLALGVGGLINRFSDNIDIVIEPASVFRVAVGASVVAAIGALLPVWRIARVDPAAAFRSAA
jgi:ABC-type transport system, involved in lipoprotein release, permease component